MTNRVINAIAISLAVACVLSIDISRLTLTHSKGKCHAHNHFDCECITNDDRQEKTIIAMIKLYEVTYDFPTGTFTFDLGPI